MNIIQKSENSNSTFSMYVYRGQESEHLKFKRTKRRKKIEQQIDVM